MGRIALVTALAMLLCFNGCKVLGSTFDPIDFSASYSCRTGDVDACYLIACVSDPICTEILQLRLYQLRHNCYQIQAALNMIVTYKLATEQELDDLCASNSTHAAILLRQSQPCPIGFVFSVSEHMCICKQQGFCADHVLNHNNGVQKGRFTLWLFGMLFLGLFLLLLRQLLLIIRPDYLINH